MKAGFILVLTGIVMFAAAAEKIDYRNDFSKNSENLGCWQSDVTTVMFSKDADEGHRTAGSAKIELRKNATKEESGCYNKFFSANRGKTYTAIVWVKCANFSGSGNVSLSFQGWDKDKNFISGTISETKINASECEDWKRIVLTFKIPNDGGWSKAEYLLLLFGAGCCKEESGSVYFDDLEFFEEQ